MKRISRNLLAGLSLLVLTAASAAAEEAAPGAPAITLESKEGPDSKILKQVQDAQNLYLKGLALFQEGKYRAAKKNIRNAFEKLASLAVDAGLAEKIRPEVESLGEKIRSEETPEIQISSSALDIPREELQVVAGADAAAAAANISTGKNFTIKINSDDKLTQKYLTYYAKGPRRHIVLKALEVSGRYRTIIESALQERHLPKELFYLVMVESEYKSNAYSRAGAAGLWQLMPATARKLGLKVSYWIDERFDPEKSTLAAMKYLEELFHLFDDWHLALAAYNRGEYGIGRDLRYAKATQFSDLAGRGIPAETSDFVPKFMACALIGENPQDYGFFPKYEKPESFDLVTIEKPLDLKIAAQCAGTTEETLRRLNPAIRAWCTPINYPEFPLRIPKGTKDKFLTQLAQVKDWNPGRGFVRHKIRAGDALSRLARQYHTTVTAIMKDNKISDARRIRPGQVLNIQPGRKYFDKN